MKGEVDWEKVNYHLAGIVDPVKRDMLFTSLDPTGTGNVRLGAFLKWVSTTKGLEAFQRKPFLLHNSFNYAKNLSPSAGSAENETIQRSEFGPFLMHLRTNLAFAQFFHQIDEDQNAKITKEEFIKVWPSISNLVTTPITDPLLAFEKLDQDENNAITLGEFLTWAWKNKMTVKYV